MQELIDSLKAQAYALEQEGRTELAARARSEARRLEKRKKELEGKEQAHEQQTESIALVD
jgi:BMFP domain-containing protein YqiC